MTNVDKRMDSRVELGRTLKTQARIEMLEREVAELSARLYERDKAFDRIRRAYIGGEQ